MATWEKLLEGLKTSPINSTHSHHLKDHQMEGMTLFRLIKSSYINWIINDIGEDTPENRVLFFEKYGVNSYAFWLIRAIEELYPLGKPLSAETWDEYDALIRKAYEDPQHHLRILKENCGYENVILDKYDDPGFDNGHPELFRPTLRCDSFFNGYDRELRDHDGTSAYDALPFTDTLEEYVTSIGDYIRRCAAGQVEGRGICALKIGMAYERDLHFENNDIEKAKKAFLVKDPDKNAVRDFQDYLMYRILDFAAQMNLPVQIHTGLATLEGTNAMALCNLVKRYPSVRFDLFHGSFPWTDDILGMAHNFNTVYADLCWLPIISTTRAITFIKEALEVTDATRLLWGCDTWTSEESYGAVLAGRYALAKALGDLVDEGRFSETEALRIGKRILYQNAKELFGF